MKIINFKDIFKIILFLISFALLCYRFGSDLSYHPFHQDEKAFVQRSRLFDSLFINHDFNHEDWQVFALEHSPLAYYIYGLTLHLHGYQDLAKEQKKIGFNLGYLDKQILGWPPDQLASVPPWWVRLQGNQKVTEPSSILMPSFEMIWKARKAAVVFSLGCLLLVYFLGLEIGGFLTGILSVLFLGFNRLMYHAGRRAMADSILLFFLLANVLLLIQLIKSLNKERWLRFLILAFLVGVNAGLATSSKLNGGMTLIVWSFIFLLILVNFQRKLELRKKKIMILITGFLISITVAFHLLFLLSPYLYKNPVENLWKMIEHRLKLSDTQQEIRINDALLFLPDKFRAVLKQTLMKEGEWNNLEVPFLDLLFFLTGLGLIAANAVGKFLKEKIISSQMVVFAWILITFIALVVYIPLDWPRYYLPVVPCVAVAQAHGFGEIGRFVWLKLKERRQ